MTTESQSVTPGAGAEAGAAAEGPLHGVLAEYETPGELIAAAENVRDAGYTKWDCHSPFPVHGLDPAMGIRPTILPLLVFGGGLAGLGGSILLVWWMNAHDWPWIVSGTPEFSLPANIPVLFESTILIAGITAFMAVWALNKLPKLWNPLFQSDRFLKATDNGFFISVEADDPQFERGKTEGLLRDAGATHVEAIHLDPDPGKWQIPRPIMAFIAITAILGLVPFSFITKARVSHGDEPRIHVFPDMDFQPHAKSQQRSPLFDDDKASRPPVDGTVARGQLREDDHYYRGLDDAAWATTFPEQLDIDRDTMERGQVQYDVYCAPCHGYDGRGGGAVQERAEELMRAGQVEGWVQPTDLHTANIIEQPHGQLYNTISHGIRTMPGYRSQIDVEDRWAIVLYTRALQRSQRTLAEDAPEDERHRMR